jgi:hypothetical protein
VVVVSSKERFRYMKLSKLNINLKKEDGGTLSLSLSLPYTDTIWIWFCSSSSVCGLKGDAQGIATACRLWCEAGVRKHKLSCSYFLFLYLSPKCQDREANSFQIDNNIFIFILLLLCMNE